MAYNVLVSDTGTLFEKYIFLAVQDNWRREKEWIQNFQLPFMCLF